MCMAKATWNMDINFYADYLSDGPMVEQNINWTIKQLIQMLDNGTASVSDILQRSFKWEVERRSYFIHSVLFGFIIPDLYANKVTTTKLVKNAKGEEKEKVVSTYFFLDGKQRLMSLYTFKKGEYALTDIPPVIIDGELVDINGKKYEELPEVLRDLFDSRSLKIKYYDNMSASQKRELFKRLNNGKPLTAKEKNIASCVDISSVGELGNHEFFKAVFTEKALAERKAIPVVVKMHEMLTKAPADVSFESKEFNEVMAHTRIGEADGMRIKTVLDKALAVYSLFEENDKMPKRKLGSETNLVSLVPFIHKAIEDGISDKLLCDFIKSIFHGRTSVSDRYASAARSGPAKTSNIVIRHEEMKKAFEEFFKADEEEKAEVIETEAEAETEEKAVEVEEPVAEAEVPAEEETRETEASAEAVESAEATEETEDEPKYYKYGMRMRGAAPACQPLEGWIDHCEDPDGVYYEILLYDRELTDQEVHDYELDRL